MRKAQLRSRVLNTLVLFLLFCSTGVSFVHAQTDIALGSGTVGNTTTGYPCPIQDYFEGSKAQYLFNAAELTAAGMFPGTITGIKFNIISLGTTGIAEQYTIRIGGTSVASLSSTTWETVTNTVFGPFNYQPTTGTNAFTFSTPYTWNGTDNIIIEICNGDPNNASSTTYTNNPVIPWTTNLSFNGSHTYRADGLGNLCGTSTTTNTGTQTTRPNIIFSWIPGTSCSGNPVAGNAVSTLTNIVCPGSSFTLSLTGATVASGITYQWQSSTNTSTWTNILGATTASYTTTQSSALLYYRCVVTCNGSLSSNSSTVQVTAASTSYTTLPFTETFETTWLNGCDIRDIPSIYWRSSPSTGNNSWRREDDGAAWTSTTGAYTPSGSNSAHSARFHSYSASNGTKGSLSLFLDCTTGAAFKKINFDYINTSGTDTLSVLLSTNGGATFTRLDSVGLAGSWRNKLIEFISSSATTVIRFEATSDFGTTDLGIDNIKVDFNPVYVFNQTFTNGQSISTCSGNFYDSNPASGVSPYSNNENYTVTFLPGSANRAVRIAFSEMGIGVGDSLEVFDGLNVTATRLAVFNQTNNFPATITATLANTNNALTIRFRSDASITGNGWKAAISCVMPCQPFTGNVAVNGVVADATGAVAVCANTPLTFTANMSYPNSQPAPGYTQINSINKFNWQFGGFANDTAAIGLSSLVRTITRPYGYYLTLLVTDTNNCSTTIPLKIKTSVKPTITAVGTNVCIPDQGVITATFQKNIGAYIKPPLVRNLNIAFPDNGGGTSVCNFPWFDTIKINTFQPGLTLTNVNDFIGVSVNMEHSYMGDIALQLIAPNGTIIDLKPFISTIGQSGGETDWGEPIPGDPYASPTPGRGYTYRFTPVATQSMISLTGPNAGTSPTHSYVGTNGTNYNNAKYLPAGDYAPRTEAPATPFTNMLGTPLNGNWTLRYCDNNVVDNGFMFWWNLEFAPTLPTTTGGGTEQYSVGTLNTNWLPTTTLLSSLTTGNVTTGRIQPATTSTYNYTFRYIDSFNCVYDTTVQVIAKTKPLNATFGPDTLICRNSATTVAVTNVQPGITYSWFSNSTASGTALATGTTYTTPALPNTQTFYLLAKNDINCPRIDSVRVRVFDVLAKPIVTLTNATTNTLTFSWPSITGATGYLVSINNGTTFVVPSSGSNGTTHTISGLHPAETKDILVKAIGVIDCQKSADAAASGTTLIDELYIPNSFSPNGDGKNDIWKAYGYLIKEIQMKVFNQWGQLIFESNDSAKGWDGTFKGQSQPAGVYIYTVRVLSYDGSIINRKGSINLVK